MLLLNDIWIIVYRYIHIYNTSHIIREYQKHFGLSSDGSCLLLISLRGYSYAVIGYRTDINQPWKKWIRRFVPLGRRIKVTGYFVPKNYL